MQKMILGLALIVSALTFTIKANADTVTYTSTVAAYSSTTLEQNAVTYSYNAQTKTLTVTCNPITSTRPTVSGTSPGVMCNAPILKCITDTVGEVHNLVITAPGGLNAAGITTIPGNLYINCRTITTNVSNTFSNIEIGGNLTIVGEDDAIAGISLSSSTVQGNIIIEAEQVTGSMISSTIKGNIKGTANDTTNSAINISKCQLNGDITFTGIGSSISGTSTSNCIIYGNVNISAKQGISASYCDFRKQLNLKSTHNNTDISITSCLIRGESNVSSNRTLSIALSNVSGNMTVSATTAFNFGSWGIDDSGNMYDSQPNYLYGSLHIAKVGSGGCRYYITGGNGTITAQNCNFVNTPQSTTSITFNLQNCVGIIKTQGTLNADQCDLGQVVCGGGTLTMNITALRLLDK